MLQISENVDVAGLHTQICLRLRTVLRYLGEGGTSLHLPALGTGGMVFAKDTFADSALFRTVIGLHALAEASHTIDVFGFDEVETVHLVP